MEMNDYELFVSQCRYCCNYVALGGKCFGDFIESDKPCERFEPTQSIYGLAASKEQLNSKFGVENAKYDQGKNRLDLVFPSAIEELGKVRTYGLNKYHDPNNWKGIDNAKARYTAAAMRHFEAWRSGEKIDPESGLNHLSHCMCNLMFLIELEKEENE